jgi:putative salt-induced outer membrane protein YdiY
MRLPKPICRRNGMVFIALFFLILPLYAKRKDDVIVMKNGDHFTGEIKGMQRGALSFKASYMSESMSVDWREVAKLTSLDRFIITLTNGDRLTGTLMSTTPEEGISELILDTNGTEERVEQPSIVDLEQQERTFWNQLRGSADLGFTYTSGNSSTDVSTSEAVSYETQKYLVGLNTSLQFSRSTEESTNRFTFTNVNQRMISPNWFTSSYVELLSSDQQELDLRSTIGGGFGRRLKRSPTTSLSLSAGGVYTHERYSASVPGQSTLSSGELLLGISYTTFRFKTLDVSSELNVFPSVTDPGRLRMTTQSNLKFELVRNLYWSFRFYENFDSRPPVSAPKNDVGVTSSVGWKF